MKWEDVTVRQFQQLDAINKSPLSDFDKQLRRIDALFNVDAERLPLDKLKDYNAHIASLPELPKDSLNVVLKGYKVNFLVSKITGANFIDLTEYTKNPDAIVSNMHKIVALFLTPKTGWFKKSHKTQEQIEQDVLGMKVSEIYPLSLFFCKVLTNLSLSIATSFRRERWMRKVMGIKKKRGDGL